MPDQSDRRSRAGIPEYRIVDVDGIGVAVPVDADEVAIAEEVEAARLAGLFDGEEGEPPPARGRS